MALNAGYVARETTQNLGRNPTLTLASIITVAIALTLAGVALLVREGTNNLAGKFRGDVELIIFLDPAISGEQRAAIQTSLDRNPEVSEFAYVDEREAFEEAQDLFADQPTMLRLLREGDVPTSFRVEPTNPDFQSVVALRGIYEREAGVQQVESATEAIRAIQELTEKLNFGVLFASAVSAGVSVLLIYNTIRTAMFARRREIEVMKLVGATNWFIRVPFILEGVVQALLGGALAVGLLLGLNVVLFGALAENQYFELFQNFDFTIATVVGTSVPLVLVGVAIGALGSGFAVGRFLDV
ncbi:cell division protein FtsX [Iamia sp.]|uniref:cell division protein FtsX n=1 Tax=Iamia sp. TaxID=2722710 RepID=UPI002CA07663|nr:permease-like cell division protein FtsX [Iamia sp.]HXH59339.1 permease-like cell division protein FtsX [Iamia sp.]